MPRIFVNLALHLLPNLSQAVNASYRANFCVKYYNLRGWKELGDTIENWPGGDGHCVRLLVGMQRLPEENYRS